MTRTVVGLFDSPDEAHAAAQELISLGVPRDSISLVARDIRDAQHQAPGQPILEAQAAEGATAGALGGGMLGGILGLLLGIGALTIPGVGPLVLAGPLATALGSGAASTLIGAGVGALGGGLMGGLVGAGIPEAEAGYYAEGVRRGGILLTAYTDDGHADAVQAAMLRSGAVNMQERVAQWRETGWQTGATAEPSAVQTTAPASAATDALEEQTSEEWASSDKRGTMTGTAAGAAAGAAIGAVAGAPGAVVGSLVGGAVGAGTGAAADVSDEQEEEATRRPTLAAGYPGAHPPPGQQRDSQPGSGDPPQR